MIEKSRVFSYTKPLAFTATGRTHRHSCHQHPHAWRGLGPVAAVCGHLVPLSPSLLSPRGRPPTANSTQLPHLVDSAILPGPFPGHLISAATPLSIVPPGKSQARGQSSLKGQTVNLDASAWRASLTPTIAQLLEKQQY